MTDSSAFPADSWGFKREALDASAKQFQSAADDLKGVRHPSPPDCGVSSEIVANAIGRLVGATKVMGAALSTAGSKIDSAHGSYGNIDQTEENRFKVISMQNDGTLPK